MKDSSNEEITIKQIIKIITDWVIFLFKRWKIIVLFILLGGIIGFYYALKQPVTYTAKITYIQEESHNSNSLNTLSSQFGLVENKSSSNMFSGTTLIDLMKSNLIIQRILLKPINIYHQKISMADYYIHINNDAIKDNKKIVINIKPNSNPDSLSLEKRILLNSIYNDLISEKNLSFGDKKFNSTFPSIQVTSKNESFSKLFCEILLEETTNFYVETKTRKAKLNILNLQKQLDSIRRSYNNSVIKLANANDFVFNSNPALKSKTTQPAQRQVDVQANTAVLSTLISNLETAKSNLNIETPLFQIIDKPQLPLLKNSVSKIKSVLTGSILSLLLISSTLISINLFKRNFK